MVFEFVSILLLASSLMQIDVITENVTEPLPALPPITWANAFGDVTSMLVLLVLMLGITAKTLGDFYDKLRTGKIEHFDKKFFGTAVAAFITSLMPALYLFPDGSKLFLAWFGQWGIGVALLVVFFYAAGWNWLTNKIFKVIEGAASKSAASSEPSPTTTTTNPPTP
jgi:hypothetical protein